MQIIDLGLIHYKQATEEQLKLVDKLIKNPEEPEYIIACSHPPIVTLGRASKDSDLFGWQGDIEKVSRGGKATYHGPSQIILYPILHLQNRNKNLHQYLRDLEDSLILSLKEFSIEAHGNVPEATGVWIKNRKIASIGIAVKKWVSYHGIAMNYYKDEKAFSGISPCGFSQDTMISLEEVIQPLPDIQSFKEVWIKNLSQVLNTEKP